MKFGFLSNNALKIIACITMFIDHLGFIFFPTIALYRIIGRIAFPLFAFMIAEGCYYTKNKIKHLALISGFAIVMQVVLYIATQMTDFNIFIPFSIAIIIIYLIDYADLKLRTNNIIFGILSIIAAILLTIFFYWFTETYTYFYSNYGFYSIIIPVVLFIIKKYLPNINHIVCIPFICFFMFLMVKHMNFQYQLWGMLACIFILLYNGKKGKLNLKYIFYFFYPLHLVLLYGIQMFIGG